jgi:hypothetical protein
MMIRCVNIVFIGVLLSVGCFAEELVRPLDSEPFFELTNLRQDKDSLGHDALIFDFKRTKSASGFGACFVKGKTEFGPMAVAANLPAFQESGSMTLSSFMPSIGTERPAINVELYVVNMHTVGDKQYVYSLISNTVRLGNPGAPTEARDWTAEERQGLEDQLKKQPLSIKRYEVTADVPGDSVAVPLTAKLTKGIKLQACYLSKWCPITTLNENSDGSVHVRWDEYGEQYDCNMLRQELIVKETVLVGLDRHPESTFPAVHPSLVEKLTTDVMPTAAIKPDEPESKPLKSYPISIPISVDSEAVPADAKLAKGTKLQACFASSWNPITHLADNQDGTLTVRWDEYGAAFDCRMLRSELIIKKSNLLEQHGVSDVAGEIRTWTDVTGRFKVKGTLVRVSDDQVTLLTEAGKKITLPFSKLSQADRDFVMKPAEADNPFE